MNECEHVIVLDVCCTIKRSTTMCLEKTHTQGSRNTGIFFIATLIKHKMDFNLK